MGEQESHKRSLPREPTAQETAQKQSISETDNILPAEVVEAAKKAEEAVVLTSKPGIQMGEWNPRTQLGKDVLAGKITSIDQLFEDGVKITEPGIVDALLPGLAHEIILIGGSGGKGGGVRRTPSRRTSRMHKSGRRYKVSAMVVVGNGNGYVGMGYARGMPGRHKEIIEKALVKAKLNLIPVMRGCGSWECRDASPHSIPFAVTGKSGSVKITFMPAPRGLGLVVSDEVKKVLRLAGVEDVWAKSRGQTSSRVNTIHAVFDAFGKLNRLRLSEESKQSVGLRVGRVGLGSPLVKGGQ
ncbi:MAG: 30S ribosomal protein S5 [Candidatus Aenigmatarchaeota archaeon]